MLFLCKIFVHRSVLLIRLVAVSFVTTLLQCLALLVTGNPQLKLLLGFGGIMAFSVWLLFRPIGKERYIRTLTCAYMAAFLMGGSLQIMENLFSLPRLSFLNLSSMAALCGLLIRHQANRFQKKKEECLVPVRLFLSGQKEVELLALIDSGNSLTEPISKSPVSLVEKRALAEVREGLLPRCFRVIPFHSIGQPGGLLEGYMIEGMAVKQEGEWERIKEPIIGLTEERVSTKQRYQMILHPALLKNRRNDL